MQKKNIKIKKTNLKWWIFVFISCYVRVYTEYTYICTYVLICLLNWQQQQIACNNLNEMQSKLHKFFFYTKLVLIIAWYENTSEQKFLAAFLFNFSS